MIVKDKKALSADLRGRIQWLRTKGYTFRFFFSVVNCSPTKFYNFMRGYNNLSDQELRLLQDRIEEVRYHSEKGESQ